MSTVALNSSTSNVQADDEACMAWKAATVARMKELRPIVEAARKANAAKCPPRFEYLATAIAFYDDGIWSAETAIQGIRAFLKIDVTPESAELCRLTNELYRGNRPGAASAPAAGG